MATRKEQLKIWVDYALENKALILFDAAYEAYIQDSTVPHSIFEIEGARKCAVEFRSFSKTAGFTGLRCAYTIVPKDVMVFDKNGKETSLNALWARRQGTKFNGVAYIVQRAAEATYSEEGKKQIKETIDYYMDNAHIIREGLEAIGYKCYGGVNAPYIWLKTPDGIDSWRMFDKLLNEKELVSTPGSGFGTSGEGYIRLTAFGNKQKTIEAVERIKTLL
ncbi:hypothetical protein FACS1894153_3310 [Bacteroidia bacterium]|nr:hypothetical protein FACS1894153_3310 [Bacteroidia bacterium]